MWRLGWIWAFFFILWLCYNKILFTKTDESPSIPVVRTQCACLVSFFFFQFIYLDNWLRELKPVLCGKLEGWDGVGGVRLRFCFFFIVLIYFHVWPSTSIMKRGTDILLLLISPTYCRGEESWKVMWTLGKSTRFLATKLKIFYKSRIIEQT